MDGLFVHMMAANAGARAFYEHQGFILDQEESSNHAHYRYVAVSEVAGIRCLMISAEIRWEMYMQGAMSGWCDGWGPHNPVA